MESISTFILQSESLICFKDLCLRTINRISKILIAFHSTIIEEGFKIFNVTLPTAGAKQF